MQPAGSHLAHEELEELQVEAELGLHKARAGVDLLLEIRDAVDEGRHERVRGGAEEEVRRSLQPATGGELAALAHAAGDVQQRHTSSSYTGFASGWSPRLTSSPVRPARWYAERGAPCRCLDPMRLRSRQAIWQPVRAVRANTADAPTRMWQFRPRRRDVIASTSPRNARALVQRLRFAESGRFRRCGEAASSSASGATLRMPTGGQRSTTSQLRPASTTSSHVERPRAARPAAEAGVADATAARRCACRPVAPTQTQRSRFDSQPPRPHPPHGPAQTFGQFNGHASRSTTARTGRSRDSQKRALRLRRAPQSARSGRAKRCASGRSAGASAQSRHRECAGRGVAQPPRGARLHRPTRRGSASLAASRLACSNSIASVRRARHRVICDATRALSKVTSHTSVRPAAVDADVDDDAPG